MSQDAQTTLPRDFKGIWIPREIWLDSRLTYFEKLLLAEINSLDGENGCYASNEYLCNFFGEKLRTIQNGLAKLRSFGYICGETSDGRTRFIHTTLSPNSSNQSFTPQTCKILHPTDAKSCTPSLEAHTLYKNKDHIIDLIDKVKISDFDGKEKEVSKNDLFFMASKFETDWTAEEIELIFKRLAKHKGSVRDLLQFCKAIIQKERTTKNQSNQGNSWKKTPKNSQNSNKQSEPIKKTSSEKAWTKVGTSEHPFHNWKPSPKS